jgi:hypothetical protein
MLKQTQESAKLREEPTLLFESNLEAKGKKRDGLVSFEMGL